MKREAPLSVEDAPALYVYRLRLGEHEQTGVAGCSSLDEYDKDVVRRHERTRRDKEDDRTRHMVTLKAQTGPVFLTYRDLASVDALVADAQKEEPLFDFTAPDGVAHTVWRLPPETTKRLAAAFEAAPLFYIADGHHRAASAARARDELRAADPAPTGAAAYDRFLTVVFPASQVRILPYNRVVKDLGNRSSDDFLGELRRLFPFRENAPPAPRRKGEVSLYLAGRWYGFELPPASGRRRDRSSRRAAPRDGTCSIRCSESKTFGPTSASISSGASAEFQSSNGWSTAEILPWPFSMHAVSVNELMAISDAGQIMPPKSTWFEPKLRDGLLIHEISA